MLAEKIVEPRCVYTIDCSSLQKNKVFFTFHKKNTLPFKTYFGTNFGTQIWFVKNQITTLYCNLNFLPLRFFTLDITKNLKVHQIINLFVNHNSSYDYFDAYEID